MLRAGNGPARRAELGVNRQNKRYYCSECVYLVSDQLGLCLAQLIAVALLCVTTWKRAICRELFHQARRKLQPSSIRRQLLLYVNKQLSSPCA